MSSPSLSPAHPSTVATVGDGAKHHLKDGAVGGLGGSLSDADFNAFYYENRGPLFGTLRKWLFSTHDAEECVNDAFRLLSRGLARFRGDCSLRTYLFRIGVNLAHNRYARNCRRRYYSNLSLDAEMDGMTIADTVAAPDVDPLVLKELERGVRTGLERLAPRDRDIIELYEQTEMDYEALSVALGIPMGTVKSRLSRARGKLRKAMGVAA